MFRPKERELVNWVQHDLFSCGMFLLIVGNCKAADGCYGSHGKFSWGALTGHVKKLEEKHAQAPLALKIVKYLLYQQCNSFSQFQQWVKDNDLAEVISQLRFQDKSVIGKLITKPRLSSKFDVGVEN